MKETLLLLEVFKFCIYVNGNHWITISTINTITAPHYDVTVFDSINFTLSKNTEVLIAKLLKTPKKRIAVKFANLNKQAGFDDCGVFAAAYSTTLAHGQNPCSYIYDQSVMREHLIKCLEGLEIQPFPVIRGRRIGAVTSLKIDVYCYCRCPDDGTRMVQCDMCKDWFHLSCIDTPVEVENWYCKNCHV